MTDVKRIRLFLGKPDDTQLSWASRAQDAAREARLELVVEWSDDPSAQTRQISECVWKDLADALIILPGARTRPSALFEHALRRGKGVVIINQMWNDLDPDNEWSLVRLRRSYPSLLIVRVSPDEKEIGRLQGRQVRALLPRGGRVLYVRGDSFSATAVARAEGFDEAIGGERSWVCAKVSADWTVEGRLDSRSGPRAASGH